MGRLLKRTCPHLSDVEAAACDAPFPDARFKAGFGGPLIWYRIGPMLPERRCRGSHEIGGETSGAAAASWPSALPTRYWAKPSWRVYRRSSAGRSSSGFRKGRDIRSALTPPASPAITSVPHGGRGMRCTERVILRRTSSI